MEKHQATKIVSKGVLVVGISLIAAGCSSLGYQVELPEIWRERNPPPRYCPYGSYSGRSTIERGYLDLGPTIGPRRKNR